MIYIRIWSSEKLWNLRCTYMLLISMSYLQNSK